MFKLLELIKKSLKITGIDNNGFIFPYSADKTEKREQIWANLQKGLLMEDKQVFIPWGTPYNEIDQIKESRKYRADRTEWYLGKRTILGGYDSNLEIVKWLWKTEDAITKIDENLGYDENGIKKFYYLKDYLTGLLGDPKTIEIKKFGSLDIGEIKWENGIIAISIAGLENLKCRYSFHISLIKS